MKFKDCVLEIGANIGVDSIRLHREHNLPVLAVEPTPALIQHLLNLYGHSTNVHVLPFAIDIESGIKKFNISGKTDWGCSSLHELSPNVAQICHQIPHLKFDDFSYVTCITGQQLCEIFGIESIEYLWMDTQGNDFNILKSFGEKIRLIKKGNCEAAYRIDLYQVNNNYQDIVDYLHSYGFETIVGPDGLDNGECDIFFERK